MKCFSAWITYTAILILLKTDHTESGRKIQGIELRDLADLWKNTVRGLTHLVKNFPKDAPEKGELVTEDVKKNLKEFLKMVLVFNRRLEHELDELSKKMNAEENTHEFQFWKQSLTKSIKQVYEKVDNVIENVGLEVLDSESIEKMEKELDNSLYKALALTLLLRNSKHNFEDRAFLLMSKIFKNLE